MRRERAKTGRLPKFQDNDTTEAECHRTISPDPHVDLSHRSASTISLSSLCGSSERQEDEAVVEDDGKDEAVVEDCGKDDAVDLTKSLRRSILNDKDVSVVRRGQHCRLFTSNTCGGTTLVRPRHRRSLTFLQEESTKLALLQGQHFHGLSDCALLGALRDIYESNKRIYEQTMTVTLQITQSNKSIESYIAQILKHRQLNKAGSTN